MTTIYDVIRRPLVTEKSNYQSNKLHQYSFEVASEATRTLVKDAIETLFDVKVVRVNIMNTAAKRNRRRNRRLALLAGRLLRAAGSQAGGHEPAR